MKRTFIVGLILFGTYGCGTQIFHEHIRPVSDEAVDTLIAGNNHFRLCEQYITGYPLGLLEKVSKPRVVEVYKKTVTNIKRNEIDCYRFPELQDKKLWLVPSMEERIRLYEEQGEW